MTTGLELVVFRRLDNRLMGLPDDSPEAWDLHRRRAEALHEAFDAGGPVEVVDWGKEVADEKSTHESVELLLAMAAPVVWNKVLQPGLIYLAQKLGEKLVDEASSGAVAWVIGKLRPKQESKKILDFEVTVSGMRIRGEAPEQGGAILITMPNGEVTKIEFESPQAVGSH